MNNRQKYSWLFKGIAAGALLLGIGFSTFASEIYRNVDTTQKVYDYADILTDDEESALQKTCNDIIESAEYDVFLLTIEENNIDYATSDKTLSFLEDFGDENGFGLGMDQDYVAFIIDMDERSYNIDVVGEHALLVFSTEIQEDIKDRVADHMSDGDYYGAMDFFLQRVIDCGDTEVSSFVGSEQEWQEHKQEIQQEEKGKAVINAVCKALIGAAVLSLVIVLCKSQSHKNIQKATHAYPYADASTFRLTRSEEHFLRRYTTTRAVNTSSGSGGSSGRSSSHHTSTHRSSGGRSHGGGGSRKF